MRRRALLAAALLGAACDAQVAAPRDQWIVVVATDAPVTQLGDRVLVELLDRDGKLACGSCRRELGVTPETDAPGAAPPTFPMSFGVVADDGVDRVRIRLYRTDRVGADGLPLGDHIDAVGRLPQAREVTEVALVLDMRCFGVSGDADAQSTCDPTIAALGPVPTLRPSDEIDLPAAGSWPPAIAKPCRGAVPPEMACIAGTAFLLGADDPLGGVGATSSLPERLIGVAPFAIDRDEMTVGLFRSTGVATDSDPVPRASTSTTIFGLCTYPADASDTSRDAYPVDCVSRAAAESACAALGKRLPSEEEWELAAGSRGLESSFPWGDEGAQTCARAIVARGRTPLEQVIEEGTRIEEFECRGALPAGPVPGGNELDVTVEGVRNMAGNVDEWVADGFAPYTDPCWTVAPGTVRRAPCGPTVVRPAYAVRGGSYVDIPAAARVTSRKSSDGGVPAPARGFRCALSL